jgi:flagellar protein FliO/FliZ
MQADLHVLLTGFAALAVVLGLVWAGARVARLSGLAPRRADGRLLAVRDALALDSRRRLLVVRCGRRDVVLLTGGGQDLVVGWLEPAPAASGSTGEREPEA